MRDEPYWWVRVPKNTPHYHADMADPCEVTMTDYPDGRARIDGREALIIAGLTVFLLVAFAVIALAIGALGGGQ